MERVKKTIRASLSSTNLQEDEEIFNTEGRIITLSSDSSMTEDQLGTMRFLANGYDQTNQPPDGYNPSLNANCPVAMIHNGQEQFKLEMKELGIEADWNLASLPYHYDARGGKPLVCMMLHYQTTDELPIQKLTETAGLYGHTARRRRSNGALASFTPSHLSNSVGHDNFNDACYLDIYPFAHPKGGSPTDVLTAQQVNKVMESWNRNVLKPIHKHKQTVVALCSKETERLYAKHVAGGTVKGLNKIYLENTDKFISAEEGKLVSGYHPSAMYDPLHWSNMGLKTRVMDTFMTNAKIAITSDHNVEKCTFSAGFLDTDSEFFKLMQARYLAGCSLGGQRGGARAKEMRRDAEELYAILLEDGFTRDEALEWIESELSPEHLALFTNSKNFAATSRLASEMLVRDVPNKEIEKIAQRLGMKASTLRENAQAIIDNWKDQGESNREAVSVYCAKTGVLLENCVSIASASPSLWDTVGNGLLREWTSSQGADRHPSVQDIKNAGSDGLLVGNSGTVGEPERIFILKMSTGKEKITLSDKKRQKILNDGKTEHEKRGLERMSRATDTLYVMSKADEEGNILPPFAKARNIADALYNEKNNPDGIREHFGSKKKRVRLNDAAILKEMDWQKKNKKPVTGFRDDALFKDGGRGKVKPHPERVRYIVILEKDEQGRSAQDQYDSLPLLDMTEKKKNEKETAGKKRKAESKTDEKDGIKKRKTGRKG